MQNVQTKASPRKLLVMNISTAVLVAAATAMAFLYAPTEQTMGAVQRIFYFHVGAAWAGALAFVVTAVAGVLYLRTNNHRWDVMGHSSVEVGLALITMTITSGPIWARFAWNTWWTWDAKLTSAVVMWLAYAAYLMLRQGIEDPNRRQRFAAVYGIIAFASVIMTFLGVRFIERTIHPSVIGPSAATSEGDFGLTPRMFITMQFSFFTFSIVYVTLLMHRMRLQRLSERVDQIKARLLAA